MHQKESNTEDIEIFYEVKEGNTVDDGNWEDVRDEANDFVIDLRDAVRETTQ